MDDPLFLVRRHIDDDLGLYHAREIECRACGFVFNTNTSCARDTCMRCKREGAIARRRR